MRVLTGLVVVVGVGVTVAIGLAGAGCGSGRDRSTAAPGAAVPPGEIVFTRRPAKASGAIRHDARPDLWLVRPDGSRLRRLARNAADATVSPDARLIAFVRNGAIWIMERDASGQHALTRPVAHPPPRGRAAVSDSTPAWSPDGRTIYFARWESNDETESLYRVNRDGTGLRRLTVPPSSYDGHCHNDPSPSPTGAVIAFEEWFDCNTGADISIVAITDSGRRTPLRFRFPEITVVEDPAWAPSGALMAFRTMDINGEDPEHPDAIYLSSSDGSEPRRLAGTTYRDGSPAWSPDGASIAFTREADKPWGNPGDICLVSIDGTAVRPVTSGAPDDRDPAWLAAGSRAEGGATEAPPGPSGANGTVGP